MSNVSNQLIITDIATNDVNATNENNVSSSKNNNNNNNWSQIMNDDIIKAHSAFNSTIYSNNGSQ